ncbi:ABC transporter permease [Nocardia sp. alder85J]|uniref:ABC transporter permease n=1 Tax=Nocardia sp. alder85J TaxID=2862949 RepID=UPI001CD2E8B3|nr:ABC transporter permease subunit [Nocardia sp. alder85J]MCX4097995.1 ABC transporter permease subunit [Nocardia sp. alder85J]
MTTVERSLPVASARPNLLREMSHRGRRLIGHVAVVVAVLLAWQLLAVTVFAGRFVVPSPTSVWSTIVADGFYVHDAASTLAISWKGWLLGNGIALILAAVCLLLPVAESGLMALGVATYCVPTIAVGPLLVVLYDVAGAKMVMSALSVFFVTLTAAVSGLRAASPTTLQVVTAFGGGRWAQLVKVRLRAGIPLLAGGLSVSAPAAILGTMIGDYLGGQDGLGVIMLQAQQQLAVERTWGIAVVSAAICGAAFAVTALLARLAGADVEAPLDSGLTTSRRHRGRSVTAGLAAAKLVAAVAACLVVWQLLVATSGLDSYFVKTPGDTWHYLFSAPGSSAHRGLLLGHLGQTLADAGLGWAAGTVLAVVAAIAIVLIPPAEAAVMPFVVVLRSVPLIAMCPLLGLVFGRGVLGVTVIAGIVTFVPSLVTIVGGLRAAPSAAMDIVHCSGGQRWSILAKVRVPFATAALFAAAKISMPGAILGAVLAEWLITARGLGKAMSYDIISSDFNDLFASIAALLAVSLGLYALVAALETVVRNSGRGI